MWLDRKIHKQIDERKRKMEEKTEGREGKKKKNKEVSREKKRKKKKREKCAYKSSQCLWGNKG